MGDEDGGEQALHQREEREDTALDGVGEAVGHELDAVGHGLAGLKGFEAAETMVVMAASVMMGGGLWSAADGGVECIDQPPEGIPLGRVDAGVEKRGGG